MYQRDFCAATGSTKREAVNLLVRRPGRRDAKKGKVSAPNQQHCIPQQKTPARQ